MAEDPLKVAVDKATSSKRTGEKAIWGYTKSNGPATWADIFPQAAGQRQSPVDIDTSKAELDAALNSTPLSSSYQADCCRKFLNTGCGWKVEVDGKDCELSGGPLDGVYLLEQFHCHWGATSETGSEHTIDGQSFAGELHLVHWNSTKYESFAAAAAQPDGLAVLGILLKVGTRHEELQKIVEMIDSVLHRDQGVDINDIIDPSKFLPAEKDYWTYLGSLTTPPCNECVVWIVFKEAIEVSEEQLEAFRKLRCYGEGETCPNDELEGLVRVNNRPPLPLGERLLRECRAA